VCVLGNILYEFQGSHKFEIIQITLEIKNRKREKKNKREEKRGKELDQASPTS
jgi:hypothetical protein